MDQTVETTHMPVSHVRRESLGCVGLHRVLHSMYTVRTYVRIWLLYALQHTVTYRFYFGVIQDQNTLRNADIIGPFILFYFSNCSTLGLDEVFGFGSR